VTPPPPVAVVTGAARGIGAATARHLAAGGWGLVLLDAGVGELPGGYVAAGRDELEAVAEDCRGAGASVDTVVGDVRLRGDVERAVALAGGRPGGLTAAVAAAGFVAGGEPAWATPDETWDALFGVLVTGVRHVVEAAVTALLDRPEPRSGRIVAVSSAAASHGLPRLAAYSAAKHAVHGLVRSLAADLADTGVTANAVAPGSTRTATLATSAAVYDLADVDAFAVHHTTGQLLAPEQIAAAIAWLCSPEAGGVTGTVLAVDAGMTATWT
jgi:SDR family mycofactocin-dependent oxidoreductase